MKKMNPKNEITLSWLLPLEEDEQFVGGVNKKLQDIGENNPIGGTERYGETGDIVEEDDPEPIIELPVVAKLYVKIKLEEDENEK